VGWELVGVVDSFITHGGYSGAYVIAFIGAIMAAIFGILNLLSGNIVLFIVAIFFFQEVA